MTKILLKGLAIILPVVMTAYVLYWLGDIAESSLGGALRLAVPEGMYVPGLGIAAGLVFVFVTGLLARLWLTRVLLRGAERVLERIPLVKTLYSAFRDLASFVTPSEKKKMGQTVALDLGEHGAKVLGFITREEFDDLPEPLRREDQVAVYLPMSYQVGGFTVLVPRDRVSEVGLSVEEGMRFALTAGVSREKSEREEDL